MDLYAILGVERGAGLPDIRRAYRRLARRFHPGVNPGDRDAEARYGEITLAFETLSDPARRQAYDTTGAVEASAEHFAFGFEGFDFTGEVSIERGASTFGELFADVLERAAGGPKAAPEDGADIHATVALSFEEAMHGTERPLPVVRQVECRVCGGRGVRRTEPSACAACQGRGRVRSTRGHMVFARACDHCQGTGRVSIVLCRHCGGVGVEARAESVQVCIPAGASDGLEWRLSGGGHVGRRGGRSGDLVLTLQVASHPLFLRDGDDLLLRVPVAVHEAALGARIDVPTPDGPVRLRVPPGTQSGQRLRVRGRGVPSLRTGVRGDLLIEVRLTLPALLDERSKELLREFGRINDTDVRRGLWQTQRPEASGA